MTTPAHECTVFQDENVTVMEHEDVLERHLGASENQRDKHTQAALTEGSMVLAPPNLASEIHGALPEARDQLDFSLLPRERRLQVFARQTSG